MAAANINILLRYCEIGDLEKVRNIITEKCIDVNIEDEDGITPLQVACANDNQEVVKYLLNKNADVNKSNFCGWTPLHHAAYHGHIKIVKLLISYKASLISESYFGATPLNIAVTNGHFDIVKLLIKENVLQYELDKKENICPNPLINSILHENEELVRYFIKLNPNWINEKLPITLWTPLMFATLINSEKLVKILLENGAVPNIVNVNNKSALELTTNNELRLLLQSAKNFVDKEEFDKQIYFNQKFLDCCKNEDILSFYKLFKEDIDIDHTEPSTGKTLFILA